MGEKQTNLNPYEKIKQNPVLEIGNKLPVKLKQKTERRKYSGNLETRRSARDRTNWKQKSNKYHRKITAEHIKKMTKTMSNEIH